ncbi:MAG: 4-hydroxybenzoate octaprenyltransferase [Planctomyces sp.]|nr:4-hydroxybenzoate octaprenyltransferase [Planctomyces sp.]
MATVSSNAWGTFEKLMGLIRFSHTIFAMPFAVLAAILAWNRPGVEFRWRDLAGILLCMVFARSAAMAFNRVVDRDVDAENPRTKGRHLPAGLLSLPLVVAFTIGCAAAFIVSTLCFLPNWLPLILSVPVLLFLLGYSLAKRFTVWCHYWLSAALMLSPIATWVALTGRVDAPPLWMAGVLFFWVGGFDLLYACQDAEFDRNRGLFSIPGRWGIPAALRLAAASHFLVVICLCGLWWSGGFGMVFLAGVGAIALLLIYEHAIVSADNLSRVNEAFFQVNAVISLGILALGIVDLWLRQAPILNLPG